MEDSIFPQEFIAFDMYFASVCSMQYHPGSGTRGHEPLTLEQCKAIALDMIHVRRSLKIISNRE